MKATRYIRLSHTLRPGGPRFPGNPDVVVREQHSFAKGDCCSTFAITFFNHNGTHIDFPRHYIPEGRALADYEMSEFIFKEVTLVDVAAGKGRGLVPEDFRDWSVRMAGAECLLIRTGFESNRSEPNFAHGPYITRQLAEWIRVEYPNLRCLGLDTLSITSMDSFDEGQDVHKILLGGRGAPYVIEDMSLSSIPPGAVIGHLFVAPWFIQGVDGGPCTVFAEISE